MFEGTKSLSISNPIPFIPFPLGISEGEGEFFRKRGEAPLRHPDVRRERETKNKIPLNPPFSKGET